MKEKRNTQKDGKDTCAKYPLPIFPFSELFSVNTHLRTH